MRRKGFDLLVAADDPLINKAANDFRALGAKVDVVETDLSTTEDVDKLYEATEDRAVDALLANAGHGLGHGFLDQDFEEAQGQVTNEDLKKFISDTIPVMKEHLEMAEKMQSAK